MRSKSILLVFGLTVCFGAGAASKTFSEVSGLVSMEAENATTISGWDSVAGVSGSALEDAGGSVKFTVTFNQTGHFNVYLLCRYTGGNPASRNDCFVTLDGEKLYGSDGATRPDGMRTHDSSMAWSYYPKGPGGSTPENIKNDPVYLDVTSTGTKEFVLRSRSVGFVVDKVVMKLNGGTNKPSGTGPAETDGGGGPPTDPTIITYPQVGADLPEGQTMTLRGTGSGTLTWSYNASSDGLGEETIGTGGIRTFTVPTGVTDPREITVFLQGDGGKVSVLCNIVEGNEAPTVNLTASPTSGREPLTVSFNANSSDPEGDTLTHEWDWSYPGNFSSNHNSGAAATATHDYSAGNYTAAVRVSDGHGNSVVKTVSITVEGNASPAADAGPDQTVQDDDLDDRHPVTLDGSGSSDADGSIASYEWLERGAQLAAGETPTVDFDVGVYYVTLTVTDGDGATDSDTVIVTVEFQDDDGDQMADSWEMEYFSGLSETADGDGDGDGSSNLREFEARTDPTDPSSYPTSSVAGFCAPAYPAGTGGAALLVLALLALAVRPLVPVAGASAGSGRP